MAMTVQFGGVREKVEAAKTRVTNRVAQVRQGNPRLETLGVKLESARDSFRTHAEGVKIRLKQVLEKSTAEGSTLDKVGDRLEGAKDKVLVQKERVKTALKRDKHAD